MTKSSEIPFDLEDAFAMLVAADWLQEQGREWEAGVLRGEYEYEQRNGRIVVVGPDAVSAFEDAVAVKADDQAVNVWAYSPNGGAGNATGAEFFCAGEVLESVLAGWRSGHDEDGELNWDDDTAAVFDGKKLELSRTPPRWVHQYYTLTIQDCEVPAGEVVATQCDYSGEWFFEVDGGVFQAAVQEAESTELAAIGLAEGVDQTSETPEDRVIWVVHQAKYDRFFDLCKRADRKSQQLDYTAEGGTQGLAQAILRLLTR